MLNKPKYKLVCTADYQDYKVGDVVTTADAETHFGGPWGWIQDAGCAEWQENLPTAEEIAAETRSMLTTAVQSHLDASARALGYDDIKTVCTYADEPAVAKFQTEGQAFRAWRSLVWAYCYAQLDAVTAGQRTVPTADVLIAELPKLGAEV